MTHDVGGKLPNYHNLHGNVYEWCRDWYSMEYPTGSLTDPTGPETGSFRVRRGGVFYDSAQQSRSAYRNGFPPGDQNYGIGLRVVRSVP